MIRTAKHAAAPAAILTLTLALILGAIAWTAAGSRDGQTPGAKSGQRIVSVAPSVTEILFALGVGDRIVGVTDHCDYPAEARSIEQVGGFGAPNIEKLLQLSPDLVLAAGLERPQVAGQLPQAYPHISPEKVVEWNPDVILVTGHVRSGEAAELLARRIGWSNIAAVKQRRIVDDLVPDLLLRPGPRLLEGAKALAARLYPAGNQGPEP